jgi:MATE family multidrug resistance protein
MLLDYVFVVHLQFGAKGVAAASLIAEIFQLLFGLYLVQRQLRHFPGKWCKEALLDKKKLWRTLQINMDIFIRTLCLMFSLAFFVAQGAKFGDAILAANALLVNFQLLMAHGLDGFAHAAEALVGKAVGMRNQPLIKKVVQVTLLWAFLFSSAISMIYLFAGDWIISMLTDIVAVQESAREYQIWVIVLPVVCVWAFVFDGVFIGATWVSSMRNIMLIATFLVFIPMWFAFSAWGNHGLWLSFMLFMVARAVFMSLVYFRRMNDSKNNNYYHTISEGH